MCSYTWISIGINLWNLKPPETYVISRGSPDDIYGRSICEQCLLCVTHKTSFSLILDVRVSFLQWGPLCPSHLWANVIYCGPCVIRSWFGAAFWCSSFVGSHPRAPETLGLPGPFFVNHPCGASGICFAASPEPRVVWGWSLRWDLDASGSHFWAQK